MRLVLLFFVKTYFDADEKDIDNNLNLCQYMSNSELLTQTLVMSRYALGKYSNYGTNA